tara:strand:+ start:45 stop:320 length:276 start_codon:yes stop_codon:yes gene_type:complete
MTNQLDLKEFTKALEDLPPEFKAQLASVVRPTEETEVIDTVAIKLELMKFTSELRKHNQGVDWETNKQKPKKIDVEDIIKDSIKLFEFIIN